MGRSAMQGSGRGMEHENQRTAAGFRKGAQNVNEKAREARRAYKREWNRRNAEKVKAAQARYWERKAAAAEAAKEPQTDESTQQEA